MLDMADHDLCEFREMAEAAGVKPETLVSGALHFAFFAPDEQRCAKLFVRGMHYGLGYSCEKVLDEAKRLSAADPHGASWLRRLDDSIFHWIRAEVEAGPGLDI